MNRRAALVAVAYGALLFATAPAWPDDWDGVGFVESLHDFDLARFHPHPPGYPVYVALLRLAALAGGAPMRACALVAAASGALAVALVWDAVRRALGERTAWAVALAVACAPVVWRACSGVGSEGPALACAAASAWGVVASRASHPDGRPRWAGVVLGLGAGLGLGVRLSWAPLYLAAMSLAGRGARTRAWGTLLAACLGWASPLLALVGPAQLVALYGAHLAGHAERWGGTIATEAGAIRLAWLARDVFVDGLGAGRDVLGVGIAILLLAAAVEAALAWRRLGWRGWRPALIVVAPYLLWIAIGQNLRDQPRHALPLVALLASALAFPAGRSRRAQGIVGALTLLACTRTALDAYARRTIPPPGQQLVDLARMQPSPARLAVFGVASVRFFELGTAPAGAYSAGSLGDVQVRLARLDALPARVWVTGEVEGREASPWPFERVATLCRPARIQRRAPCLDVYAWALPYLSPP